jgi:hypothetical protein
VAMPKSGLQIGLCTPSQAVARAAECERLAARPANAKYRQLLQALKCSWLQLASELRMNERKQHTKKQSRGAGRDDLLLPLAGLGIAELFRVRSPWPR